MPKAKFQINLNAQYQNSKSKHKNFGYWDLKIVCYLGFNAIKLRGIIVIPNEVRNLYIPIN